MLSGRILIVDDDPSVCTALQDWLRSEPWDVEAVTDGKEALELLCHQSFDLAVVDLRMPPPDGLEILETVRQKRIQTGIVILTAYGEVKTAVNAIKAGALEFLEKPIRPDALIEVLSRLLKQRQGSSSVLADRLDRFLKDNLGNPSLTMDDVCAHFRISRSYAARMSKEHLGATFRERVNYWRVQRARYLIESTDDPMYLVAEYCGFRNYRRLSEAFRRLEKVSPRKYREFCRDTRIK